MFANIDLAILFLFGTIAIFGLILTLISINHVKSILVRTVVVILFASFLPLGYTTLAELLGRPKPISLMWIKSHIITDVKELDAEVLGHLFVEGQGIYLYLRLPDKTEPLSLVLEWDEKLARHLNRARRDAEASGTKVKMKSPFEQSLDKRERIFYAAPQQPSPPKPPPSAPYQYTPQSGSSRSGPNR